MILVTGETIVDFIESGRSGDSRTYEAVIGGSPLNVATALARLGRPVAFFGAISTDRFGRDVVDRLVREGVDTSLVRRTDRSAPLAFASLDDVGVAQYTFMLAGSADLSLSVDDLPETLPATIDCIHFGSVAAAIEPSASAITTLVERFGDDRVVSFDPNVRAAVIPDRASWLTRFDALLPRVDVLKASAEDVAWIFGTDDIEAVARTWSRIGPKLAVVTAGAEGAVAAVRGEIVRMPAAPVDCIDTIGAGDAFQGTLLEGIAFHGLMSKSALAELDPALLPSLIGPAIAVAGRVCERRGADFPRGSEIAELLSK